MFSIHTPQGVAYKGPLENLHTVSKVSRSARTRQIEEGGDDSSPHQHAIHEYLDTLKGEHQREPLIHTFQIMTQPVYTIAESLTLEDAWQQFTDSGHQVLPIVKTADKSPDTALSGAIEYKEIAKLMIERRRDESFFRQTVGAFLSSQRRQVIAAAPIAHVRRVASVLVDHDLSALPVVDENNAVIGIVSRTDILRCVVNDPPFTVWC